MALGSWVSSLAFAMLKVAKTEMTVAQTIASVEQRPGQVLRPNLVSYEKHMGDSEVDCNGRKPKSQDAVISIDLTDADFVEGRSGQAMRCTVFRIIGQFICFSQPLTITALSQSARPRGASPWIAVAQGHRRSRHLPRSPVRHTLVRLLPRLPARGPAASTPPSTPASGAHSAGLGPIRDLPSLVLKHHPYHFSY
ncbi:hypothetical protein K438DRAFT_1774904 [Mycena galopus ATCC 62051]|nr:hypothetical protein K438DRAFT_1774904 [Mycena galopus ATCC 62051]